MGHDIFDMYRKIYHPIRKMASFTNTGESGCGRGMTHRCSLKPSGNRDNDHGSWGKKWPAWKMVMSIA
jgi:hypothetical protein